MADELNRRTFLKGAALAAGPGVISSRGANDKLNIGWIGVGTRGYASLDWMHTAAPNDVQITNICDTYQGYIARAKDRMKTIWGTTPKTHIDYHELLADKDVDAVFIMTPEHLHHDMAIAAFRAGKHVYVEKPLAHTIEEGWNIVKEWEKSKKICQVGTQNRSSTLYKRAKEMVQKGMIGDVHFVRAFWYRNSLPNDPAWRYVIPDEATPQNTDWKRFLGTAPKRDWDPRRYFQWRLYWDYSGGISTDLLVHQTDISNFVLDKTVPMSCMASGGIYMWGAPDDREVPDTLSAIYEYPDKFHLNYSCYFGNDHFGYGEEFLGSEGTLRVLNRQTLDYYPQRFGGKPIKNRAEVYMHYLKDFNQPDATADHIHNFLMAVVGKEKAIAPARAGQIAAIPGHLATLSYRNNKKLYWDEKTEKLRMS